MAAGLWSAAMAVPAKLGLTTYIQPDGTEIKIKITGDEHGHMIYSEDGLLLVERDGKLEYASFDSEGYPRASGISATSDGGAWAKGRINQTEENISIWVENLAAVIRMRL